MYHNGDYHTSVHVYDACTHLRYQYPENLEFRDNFEMLRTIQLIANSVRDESISPKEKEIIQREY